MTAKTKQTSIDLLHEALTEGYKKGKFQEPLVLEPKDNTFSACGVNPGDYLTWEPDKQAIFQHIPLNN